MRTEARATYRLQLRAGFGFAAAARQSAYLAALGVSHVFSPPVFEAAPGSTHGYDVAAPDRVNRELGGEAGFAGWRRERRRHGLGLLLDIVPNHMVVTTARNRCWWDVLRRGRGSPYAAWFDIAWNDKIVLPWLALPLAEELRRGHIRLLRQGRAWILEANGMRLPTAPGSAREGDSAAEVLARQHYRLAPWQAGDRELNYRRFFDIASLAGVRVEDPAVFAATHARVLEWLRDGTVEGLRIDHLDGLQQPAAYLGALRRAAPGAWTVAEKILARGEELPRTWAVDGTTGYDFLNLVLGLLLDPRGERRLDRAYRRFAGRQPEFAALVRRQRERVLRTMFRSEVRRLADELQALRPRHALLAATPRADLLRALRTLAAVCPVYRTYVGAHGRAGAEDARVLRRMVAAAQRRDPGQRRLYSLLGRMLGGGVAGAGERAFLLRFQQLTPAVFAKAVEDTAFYDFQRLVALNEVGGDPARFGVSLREFHAACARAQRRWPRAMLATATHDTKRGEDVRARLALLSEIPDAWQRAVLDWARHNARHRSPAGPDRNLEYLMYQTMVGAWPITAERLDAYLLKAAREAKQHTSWRQPDAAYERALHRFVHAVLRDREFVRGFENWLTPLLAAGRVNALTQALLKLTAPGVPDIYNGTELWDLSLVDPDNRRPVDFPLRRKLLQELARGLSPEAIWARQEEGLPKLWVLTQALRLRREVPQAFGSKARYQPIWARGAKAGHVVAFARTGMVVTVAPRLPLRLGAWGDTQLRLPPGRWRNVLTGDDIGAGDARLEDLLGRFPVGLLRRDNKE